MCLLDNGSLLILLESEHELKTAVNVILGMMEDG